jgi:hypothetical protein
MTFWALYFTLICAGAQTPISGIAIYPTLSECLGADLIVEDCRVEYNCKEIKQYSNHAQIQNFRPEELTEAFFSMEGQHDR